MNTSEFKAWFEGYVENIEGEPNKKQFKRIKSRVAEINGQPVTEKVFIDRYYPRYLAWDTVKVGEPVFPTCQIVSETASDETMIFNPTAAMTALGRMDFEGDGGTTV